MTWFRRRKLGGAWTEKAKGQKLSRGQRVHHAQIVIVTGDGAILEEALAKTLGKTGDRFHSRAEARYWIELRAREARGEITRLERQVRIPLHAPGGQRIGHYVADFVFVDGGRRRVQDVKGSPRREDLYTWKRRHVLLEHGITIEEIERSAKKRQRIAWDQVIATKEAAAHGDDDIPTPQGR